MGGRLNENATARRPHAPDGRLLGQKGDRLSQPRHAAGQNRDKELIPAAAGMAAPGHVYGFAGTA
eukprot:3897515-Pyramimonas_sp.AAC.1